VHPSLLTGVLKEKANAEIPENRQFKTYELQGGSNMTGTDLCVNKPHCAAAVRP